MLQLIAHLLGDYVFQNQWMADNKTKAWGAACVHVAIYSLIVALLLKPGVIAMVIIGGTHLLIDRFRLARYWCEFYGVGTAPHVPPFLSVWLLIIVDNTMHLAINYAAIRFC